jgi:hypothetical protein
MNPTPQRLAEHARELAIAFDVQLVENRRMRPENALGLCEWRMVICSPVIDETTYAVALHEIGHLAAPSGFVRSDRTAGNINLMLTEEQAAWEWAQHYALIWTAPMEAVRQWGQGTYEQTKQLVDEITRQATPAPAAPAEPYKPQINWSQWR